MDASPLRVLPHCWLYKVNSFINFLGFEKEISVASNKKNFQ